MRDAQAFNILLFISSQPDYFLVFGSVPYFLSQLQWLGLFLCWGSFQEINLLELSEHLLSSATVIKKLLKALSPSVGSFNFSSFTSNVETCSTECTLLVSFFIMYHVIFIFVIIFCCKSTVVLLLSFFYNFS